MTPAETDIGVMTFALGKLADLLHEGKRFPEIAELKYALDTAYRRLLLLVRSDDEISPVLKQLRQRRMYNDACTIMPL